MESFGFSFNKISERQGNHKCTRHFRSWKLTFTLIGNSNKENTKFKIFHFPPFSQHPNRKCRSRHKIRVEKEKTNGIVMQPEKKIEISPKIQREQELTKKMAEISRWKKWEQVFGEAPGDLMEKGRNRRSLILQWHDDKERNEKRGS